MYACTSTTEGGAVMQVSRVRAWARNNLLSVKLEAYTYPLHVLCIPKGPIKYILRYLLGNILHSRTV